MSEPEARLSAVMSIRPYPPTDGELRCRTPGCKSAGRLSRKDLQCWWCGGLDFEIASEELKVWMRIPEVPKALPKPSTVPAFRPLDYDALMKQLWGLSWPTPTQGQPTLGQTAGGVRVAPPPPSHPTYWPTLNNPLLTPPHGIVGLTDASPKELAKKQPTWIQRAKRKIGLGGPLA